jgi:hypothetical protein
LQGVDNGGSSVKQYSHPITLSNTVGQTASSPTVKLRDELITLPFQIRDPKAITVTLDGVEITDYKIHASTNGFVIDRSFDVAKLFQELLISYKIDPTTVSLETFTVGSSIHPTDLNNYFAIKGLN